MNSFWVYTSFMSSSVCHSRRTRTRTPWQMGYSSHSVPNFKTIIRTISRKKSWILGLLWVFLFAPLVNLLRATPHQALHETSFSEKVPVDSNYPNKGFDPNSSCKWPRKYTDVFSCAADDLEAKMTYLIQWKPGRSRFRTSGWRSAWASPCAQADVIMQRTPRDRYG